MKIKYIQIDKSIQSSYYSDIFKIISVVLEKYKLTNLKHIFLSFHARKKIVSSKSFQFSEIINEKIIIGARKEILQKGLEYTLKNYFKLDWNECIFYHYCSTKTYEKSPDYNDKIQFPNVINGYTPYIYSLFLHRIFRFECIFKKLYLVKDDVIVTDRCNDKLFEECAKNNEKMDDLICEYNYFIDRNAIQKLFDYKEK